MRWCAFVEMRLFESSDGFGIISSRSGQWIDEFIRFNSILIPQVV